jgi:hypothetical protein
MNEMSGTDLAPKERIASVLNAAWTLRHGEPLARLKYYGVVICCGRIDGALRVDHF